jgi:hypothetical protein
LVVPVAPVPVAPVLVLFPVLLLAPLPLLTFEPVLEPQANAHQAIKHDDAKAGQAARRSLMHRSQHAFRTRNSRAVRDWE